jgi:hypothetical protein
VTPLTVNLAATGFDAAAHFEPGLLLQRAPKLEYAP